jgi:hypothetical protein
MLKLEGLLYLRAMGKALCPGPHLLAQGAICLALVGNATMVAWEKSSTSALPHLATAK